MEQKNRLKSHEKVCIKKDFFSVGMPSEEIMLLKFTQYQESSKAPSIIYLDLESLTKKKVDVKVIIKIIYKNSRWTFSVWLFNVYYMGI